MDAIDLRILRSMGIDPWGARPRSPEAFRPSALGRVVKLTPEAVRDRLARLTEAGVLRGYQIVPNLRHFGMEAACYYLHLESVDAVDKARSRLEHLPGMLGTLLYVEPMFCVNVAYTGPGDQAEKLMLLRQIAANGSFLKYSSLESPHVARPLSNLDWRIVAALRGNALRPHDEVAAQLGVTGKTVKRRFDRMAREGSFFIVPVVHWGRAGGVIPVTLNFYLSADATSTTIARLLKTFDDRYLNVCVPSSPELGHYALQLFAFAVSELDELRRRALEVPGVERVTLLVLRGGTSTTGWINDFIQSKIRETDVTDAVRAPPAIAAPAAKPR